MNYNEILERIQKGENAEDIVKEFTDNINRAQKEVAEQEAAQKANDAKSKKMDEISMAIAHALNEYIMLAGIETEKLRGAEVRELLDELLPIMEQLKNVKIHVAKTAPKIQSKLRSADDVFDWFFKKNNW